MKLKSLFLLIFAILSFNLQALEYRAYKFDELSRQLGYPNETFFGSTEDEIQDLETYISKEDEFYKEINGYLRFHPAPYDWSGTSPEYAKVIVANMDKIFGRVPSVPQNLVLFRGVNLDHRKNKSYKIGEEFIEKGYASTSTSFKVAHYFAVEKADYSTAKKKKAIFVLYQTRPGQKAILINANEDEVLLKHHQRLKVMAKRNTSPSYETYLVQLCNIQCDKRMNKDITRFWKNYKELKRQRK